MVWPLYLFIYLFVLSRVQWTSLVLVPACFFLFFYFFVKLHICSDTCVHVSCVVRRRTSWILNQSPSTVDCHADVQLVSPWWSANCDPEGRLTVSVSAGKFSVDLVKSLNWVSVCFQFWFIDNIDMYVQLNTGAKTSTSGKKHLGKKRVQDAHQGATQQHKAG